MKYWCPSSWDNSFDHEGLLFFVQKMQEMLFHFSDDIYRAPVHNTSTLAYEFLQIHTEVELGKVRKYQIKAIFDELKYSFSHDLVIKENLGTNFVNRVYSKMNSCQESEYFTLVNYIAWIADIIMRGYSGEFIYSYLETIFIRGQVSSLDILDTYFARFDFKKRKYKVYLYVSDIVASYSEILNKRLTLQFEDDGNFNKIKPLRRCHICYLEINEIDYYTATIRAYQRINIFSKYYRFLSNQRKYMLNRMGYVLEVESSEMHSLPIIPAGLKAIEIRENEAVVKTLDSIIMGIQGHNSKALGDLDKAIELHNSALRQQLPKDGLTNLWSILEVLCPKTETTSKLDVVLCATLPVLQNDYFQTVFCSIYKDLSANMSEDNLDAFLSEIYGGDEIFKVAAFCLLPEYEELRKVYFIKWSKFPLLRDKIYKLYQLRNNKSTLFALSTRYAQRVEWHLYRLYRARNAIVHAGETYPRIQVLSEHLHSYVDSVMNEVAFKLSDNNLLSDISSIFVDTRLLVDSKKDYFKDAGTMTSDDITFLLQEYFVKSAKGVIA